MAQRTQILTVYSSKRDFSSAMCDDSASAVIDLHDGVSGSATSSEDSDTTRSRDITRATFDDIASSDTGPTVEASAAACVVDKSKQILVFSGFGDNHQCVKSGNIMSPCCVYR